MSEKKTIFKSPSSVRYIIVIIMAISFFSILLVLNFYAIKLPESIYELLFLFSILSVVHLIDIFFIERALIEDVKFSLVPITKSAKNCGLIEIYESRKNIESEIITAIEKSRKRVWLLGVAFSEGVRLDDIIKQLSNKKKLGNFDLKILLLNALCSPAIFRCFLETNPDRIAKIIDFHQQKNRSNDPFFGTRLYTDFTAAHNILSKYPNLEDSVRFYSHSPSCWLVAVDDTIFFQPYTFGKSKESNEQQENLCLGSYMPVFRFQRYPDLNSNPFEIIEDHFIKLWVTSDNDLLHMSAQMKDAKDIVKRIFEHRLRWLESVSSILSKEKDRRKFPRQPCRSKLPLKITWQDNNKQIKALIKDFSREGICVEMEDSTEIKFQVGDTLTVEWIKGADTKTEAFQFIYEELSQHTNLKIIDIKRQIPTTIRLETLNKSQPQVRERSGA